MSDMEMPYVTIITVVFNGKSELEDTILSVINQTYKNIEYVIIDGGSTDGTLDILKKYSDKISYWKSEPDKGIYDAMNKGIRVATGKWINFMNCGDKFVSDRVVENVFLNKRYEGIDIIFGDSIEVFNGIESLKICSSNTNLLYKYPTYRHGASFVRAELHKENLFDLTRKDLGFALDFHLIHKFKTNGCSFKKVEEPILIYKRDGVSNNLRKSILYTYRITRTKKPFYSLIKYLYVLLKDMLGFYK